MHLLIVSSPRPSKVTCGVVKVLRRLVLGLIRPGWHFGVFVGLVSLVLAAIHVDVRSTIVASRERLVVTSSVRLGNIRDSYTQSNYASWVGGWVDVVDRVQGTGPMRIYQRAVTLPMNRDLLAYPFDSPACRQYDGARNALDVVLACALYNPDSRRLQLVLVWHEPQWGVVREGDADPARGDRIAIRVPGMIDGEIYSAAQVSFRSRSTLTDCNKEWQSEETTRRCDALPMAIYEVLPNGLLGAPLPGSNGLAFRTTQCPEGVVAPCIKAQVNMLMRPPKNDATVCLRFQDAPDRLERSTVVARTCADGSVAPLPGRFTESSVNFPLGPRNVECRQGALCLCQAPSADDPTCMGVTAGPSEDVRGTRIAGLAASLARAVVAGSTWISATQPGDANAPFLGTRSSTPVAYLVQRIETADIVEDAVPPLTQRLGLYCAALLVPLILFVVAKFAVRNTARRERDVALHRQVEADRDHARAQRALADAALQGANASLDVLGHEIMSPAQSLLNVLADFQARVCGKPYETLVKESFLDMAEGYVRRMTRATEHVRQGLQMQRRHAASFAARRPIELGAFLERRFEVEKLDEFLDIRFENLAATGHVVADRGDLEQVIANILSNSRRFASGQPIRIVLEANGPSLCMRVRNEGPVVASGKQEEIFLSGVSLSPPNGDAASHGFGLFVARMAMSAMGGTISVENDPPPATHGVVFTLTFPAAPQGISEP